VPFHEKAAYGPQVIESVCPMGENGILKGDQRLRSLYITDKTSKDKVIKQATFPNIQLKILEPPDYKMPKS
jgi:hypothetical protein